MSYKIVAVTACVQGIAHTFMSEAGLKKVAKKNGYEISVETQGGLGVQNKLKPKDIEEADVVILAIDTKISGRERFDNKKVLEVKTGAVVKDAQAVVDQALALINE